MAKKESDAKKVDVASEVRERVSRFSGVEITPADDDKVDNLKMRQACARSRAR
jgi:hypothetical protein